jgi:hypothetical protein
VTRHAEPAWYAVVDTAQDAKLYPLVRGCSAAQCLVAGDIPFILAGTLPYLVEIKPGEPLLENWRAMGVGQGWGVMMQARLSLDALRLHLKKFLNAKLPDGMVVWFRFYDPAVLLTFLRNCTAEELEPWFREIDQYLVDGDAGDGQLRLSRTDGRLAEMTWTGA